jgi:hypothetical protein
MTIGGFPWNTFNKHEQIISRPSRADRQQKACKEQEPNVPEDNISHCFDSLALYIER